MLAKNYRFFSNGPYSISLTIAIIISAMNIRNTIASALPNSFFQSHHQNLPQQSSSDVIDLWCFKDRFRVGIPNMFKKLNNCFFGGTQYQYHCDDAYDNFCSIFDVSDNDKRKVCQAAWDLKSSFACTSELGEYFTKLEKQLSNCMSTDAFNSWTNYRDIQHPDSVQDGQRFLQTRGHSVRDHLYHAWELLAVDGKCLEGMYELKKAIEDANLANYIIGLLPPGHLH